MNVILKRALIAIAACLVPSCEFERCPDLDGVWTMIQHCDESYIGERITVHQSGCAVSMAIESANFAGDVASDGDIELQGTVAGREMECDGDAGEDLISMRCRFLDSADICVVIFDR